jgi:hypothetical protein
MAKGGTHKYALGVCATLVFFSVGFLGLNAQQFSFPGVRSSRGQDVSPVFNGWERNPDGTFSMWFGYYNRNTEEALDVPIGPENKFDLGDGDQGQPTHFYPGPRWWVFKVVVPRDWPTDKRLVWTLTNSGRTNVSKGWLEPEWEVDKLLISADAASDPFTGSLGRPVADSIIAGNTAPVIMGSSSQTVALPSAVTLTVTANDDGLPKPRPSERGSDGQIKGEVQGVRVRWILYRGPGRVQFNPDVSPFVYGKPLTSQTKVSFSAPGNYRIRAIASDGALFSTFDVEVKVSSGASAEKSP